MISAVERPSTLVEHVLSAIRAEIEAGRFAPSSRLPAEKALSVHLGVSRPVLREAIARLKADGLLITKKGSGAYVADTPVGNTFRLPAVDQEGTTLRDVFELRYWAEMAAAEMAALRRTTEQLARMQAALTRMTEQANDIAIAAAADLEFHNTIAMATHNPAFLAFVEFISVQLLQTRKVSWENAAKYAGGPAEAQQEHHAIYDAIAAGNPSAARQAAQAHLLGAARRMRLEILGKNGK
jgi:GntR family transcriptional repressor for pyruvate dehydrogenase complex